MEWIAHPSGWIGLAMLAGIELVLATSNINSIDTLVGGLPAEQRRRARYASTVLGLGLRVVLLFIAASILAITTPLFSLGAFDVSPRSLLLVVGGLFLVAKASVEIHKRLVVREEAAIARADAASVWQVVAQIVVLDIVFSLDNVVTAIGLAEHLSIMVIAVVVAAALSLVASKPLAAFLQRRSSTVVLCLAILLVVGFSLFVDGLGYGLPKSYLYTAIGLAFLVEAVCQFRGRRRDQEFAGMSLRQRTAARVLGLLGRKRHATSRTAAPVETIVEELEPLEDPAFVAEEADMIQGVLTLAERPVRTIMSPRTEVQWIDIDGPPERVRADTLKVTHSVVLLCHGGLNDFVGVAATTELFRSVVEGGEADLSPRMRQPVLVHESTKVLRLIEELRKSSMPLAIVLDEYGSVAGVATPTDILEAIAGSFPSRDEAPSKTVVEHNGAWTFEGFVDIHRVSSMLGVDLVDPSHRYTTLNGYIVWKLGDLPRARQRFAFDDLEFEILAMKGRTVDKVQIRRELCKTEEQAAS